MGKKFDETAPWLVALLRRDFDLDLDGAAAIVGNLAHESGGFEKLQEINPTVPGSRGGFGWAQWTGPRRREFEAYASRNGFDLRSDKANYKFLFVELHGPERRALPALRGAHGLREKTIAFEKAFERAGVKHYDSRLRWAQKALEAARLWDGKFPAWVEDPTPKPDPVPDDPGPIPDPNPDPWIDPEPEPEPERSPNWVEWIALGIGAAIAGVIIFGIITS